jgi:hypothetical protein
LLPPPPLLLLLLVVVDGSAAASVSDSVESFSSSALSVCWLVGWFVCCGSVYDMLED